MTLFCCCALFAACGSEDAVMESDPCERATTRITECTGEVSSGTEGACDQASAESLMDLSCDQITANADVAEADISGSFDGELMAREHLIVRAGGHVKGKVRYGRIVIEAGGEVSGDMQTLEDVDN